MHSNHIHFLVLLGPPTLVTFPQKKEEGEEEEEGEEGEEEEEEEMRYRV